MKINMDSVKNFIFNDSKEATCSYSDMLGFNKPFTFILTKDKVKDQAEFDTVKADAEFIINQDLKRLGKKLYIIDPALRSLLKGSIGSMTLIADNDGKVTVKFHKRNDKGLWDETSKKFPEKETTGKFKHEIFFPIGDYED